MDYQIWIAFSDVMLLVFQLNHFLAFIPDLGKAKPNLHGAVIHILRKSRTQGLINIFSNFSNYGCLVAHSRPKPLLFLPPRPTPINLFFSTGWHVPLWKS